ncbi:MAG: hypothetical protein EB170_06580, partial [Nitrosopumilaceae archaeon]|nr:hypothetical protein [Nitrosopumilaceae archaeon]
MMRIKSKQCLLDTMTYSRAELESTSSDISICDILKNNTTKVIRKLESEIPLSIQEGSDMYT